jgi:hypothetical protein
VEQRVPGKHNLFVAVLHEPADAVLRVARRVQRLDGDAADGEGVAVLGRLGDFLAVLAADDVDFAAEGGELRGGLAGGSVWRGRGGYEFGVASGVVPVAGWGLVGGWKRRLGEGTALVSVDDGGQVDGAIVNGLFEDGCDSGGC